MKLTRLRGVLWVVSIAGLVLFAVLQWLRPAITGGALPPITISGTAQVGGPFELTDHTGKRISDKELLARGGIVTFGWSRDPDLTPALLQMLSVALSTPPIRDERPAAIFITLDPDHDGPAQLSAYLKAYHPTLVGLTGSASEINNLASAYKLYWKRISDQSLPGGYSIDFAALYYVMGPGGNFRGVVPYTTEVTELAKEIGILLRK